MVLDNFQKKENNAEDYVVDKYDPYLLDNFHPDFDLTDLRTDLSILQTFKFENLIHERAWKQNDLLNSDNVLEELRATINEVIELTDKEIKEHNR